MPWLSALATANPRPGLGGRCRKSVPVPNESGQRNQHRERPPTVTRGPNEKPGELRDELLRGFAPRIGTAFQISQQVGG